MLALIGHRDDAVCDALKRFADRAGVPVMQVCDPANWTATVHMKDVGRTTLRAPDGALVTGAVNRGLPRSVNLSSGEECDLLASWWAALAFLPGRVTNRPDARAFLPIPDVPVGTLTTRPRPSDTGNVHDAHTGQFLYRSAGDHLVTDVPVLKVTPFDPATAWRLMLVGTDLIDISLPSGGLTAHDREAGTTMIRELGAARSGFALIVLARNNAGKMHIIAINPLPALAHYAGHEEDVHAALIGWITRW
ncbi:hypothetical protein OV450_7744 [Actinobacteria bacterium OV450]|nr:hypothetical protein OV450_7744 [Actinobacteria bacterium OV450]